MAFDNIPQGRSEWAVLQWQEAQSTIAYLLSSFEYMKFEELKLSNTNRADIVVIYKSDSEVIFGVIEVKTYSKINNTIHKNAIEQVCRYIDKLYQSVNENNRWGNRTKRYFGVVVYTRDYPIRNKIRTDQFSTNIPDELLTTKKLEIFVSTPEKLIDNLQKRNLCGYSQNSLKDYFKPNID